MRFSHIAYLIVKNVSDVVEYDEWGDPIQPAESRVQIACNISQMSLEKTQIMFGDIKRKVIRARIPKHKYIESQYLDYESTRYKIDAVEFNDRFVVATGVEADG